MCQQNFKSRPINLKPNYSGRHEQDIYWYGTHMKHPKPFTFIVTKNLNKTRYFYSCNALKTNLAVISTIDSFILKFGEQYKKSNRDHDMISHTFNSPPAKAQKSTKNNFLIVFVQIPDTHKKYQLSQNIFWLNLTSIQHRQIDQSFCAQRKIFLISENCSAFFMTNLK